MKRTTTSRLASAACGLLLAAAASRAGASSPRPSLDACGLIPPADAAELLGTAPGPPVTNDGVAASAEVSQCSYRGATTNTHLTLIVRRSAAAPGLFERARASAKLLLWADPQEVPGLGDRAYWTGVTFRQLNVLCGDVWLIVAADLGTGKGRLEEARRVAERALRRARPPAGGRERCR
jgi:hypothetical protein